LKNRHITTNYNEEQLTELKRDGLFENNFLYIGDGNRVARLDENNKGTILIGNYFETPYPIMDVDSLDPTDWADENLNCTYFPLLGENTPDEFTVMNGATYYYAGNQRIAMGDAWGVYFLLSDHLGSSSFVIDESGQIVESGYYLPWGGQRGDEGIATTDYGYTGQIREGDIYCYNARWYDPAIGRFMQADTILPVQQGTQGWDRYAYVNNNPINFSDPSGNVMIQGCGDDGKNACEPSQREVADYQIFLVGEVYPTECANGNTSNCVEKQISEFSIGINSQIGAGGELGARKQLNVTIDWNEGLLYISRTTTAHFSAGTPTGASGGLEIGLGRMRGVQSGVRDISGFIEGKDFDVGAEIGTDTFTGVGAGYSISYNLPNSSDGSSIDQIFGDVYTSTLSLSLSVSALPSGIDVSLSTGFSETVMIRKVSLWKK